VIHFILYYRANFSKAFMDTDNLQSLTHLDQSGNAQMVDVTHKPQTVRRAIAMCEISMRTTTLDAIQAGNLPKGDVLGTAKLAGIMAAKQTANLIPMCHPLNLTSVNVKIRLDENIPGYQIEAEVKTNAETGVEMEAMTAVTIAALTIYDMAKSLEKTMIISNTRLVHKSGGDSGEFNMPKGEYCDM
jgi:cyclic pyranopterin phosphate synthase